MPYEREEARESATVVEAFGFHASRTHPGQSLDVHREVAERFQEQGVEVVPAGPHMSEGDDMCDANTHQCGANTMLAGRRSGVQDVGQNCCK